ncbi:MAG: DUF6306 domain-containing protein [Gammaproteobacteria bacterium]
MASHGELVARLNALLEAERAGARVALVFQSQFAPGSAVHATLHAVHRDEAHNCGVLIDLIERLGATPGTATGAFATRAIALREPRERLAFLNRGQAWVVRKLGEALELTDEAAIRAPLARMLDSHAANIQACEDLLAADTVEDCLIRGFSSPACSAHEFDPNRGG